jgi:hypothetical protein
MGLFKGMRDMKAITDMGKQVERPSLGEGLSMARGMMSEHLETTRLQQDGVPASARVLRIADTGASVNEHPVCELEVEVTRPGTPPYTATLRQMVPRLQAPGLQPGAVVAVRVDQNDPQVLALDWQGMGTAASGIPPGAAAQAGAMMASANAAVAGAQQQAAQDPVERLERLQALKEKGLLTEAEFDAQKQRILGAL